jgi:hypothetical protein
MPTRPEIPDPYETLMWARSFGKIAAPTPRTPVRATTDTNSPAPARKPRQPSSLVLLYRKPNSSSWTTTFKRVLVKQLCDRRRLTGPNPVKRFW